MTYQLSTKAQQILDHLQTTQRAVSPSDIAAALNLNLETVRSLIESLRQQKLIQDHEISTRRYYRLSTEGKRFAKQELPEIRLVKALLKHDQETSLSTLLTNSGLGKVDGQIGLGWARRNGWITVTKSGDQTRLRLAPNAKSKISQHPLQLALNTGLDTGEFGLEGTDIPPSEWKSVQQDLEKRKLAELVTQKTITVLITSTGRHALQLAREQKDLIGDLSPDLLKSGVWREHGFRPYNLQAPTSSLYSGKKHPYLEFIDYVTRVLIGLGFQEAKGPLVETEFWNSDALFMPQDHVAREVHDLYHIKTPKGPGRITDKTILERVAKTHEDGWITGSTGWRYTYNPTIARRLVLRSQTTAVSVRYLSQHQKAPLRMFSIDRNFRPEKFDATHSAEFLQCEGIIGGEALTLRDLMGYLCAIAEGVGIKQIKFKPGFFPFTEPSIEGFIHIPGLGWKEALPGGIFRPEVTRPLGIDFPVLAWGIGIDRLAMAAMGINDIRELATRNLGWLRGASMRF
ncbi:MAG: phenylalanine--tRNA ligase subunit alpha [Candidatus Hodarchaeota archaeon]